MQALIDIGKTSADFLAPYLTALEQMTLHFINSDYDRVALLAIEFWTTICNNEFEKEEKGIQFKSIIKIQSTNLLNVLF